jgi:hypothetical protein
MRTCCHYWKQLACQGKSYAHIHLQMLGTVFAISLPVSSNV